MLAVVSWVCECGTHVKVMYETDGSTTVRCPNAFCQKSYDVDGKISDLWANNEDEYKWTKQDVSRLIVQ